MIPAPASTGLVSNIYDDYISSPEYKLRQGYCNVYPSDPDSAAPVRYGAVWKDREDAEQIGVNYADYYTKPLYMVRIKRLH